MDGKTLDRNSWGLKMFFIEQKIKRSKFLVLQPGVRKNLSD